MVRRVRTGVGLREVARQFGVSVSVVSRWVTHSAGQRLDRCSFSDSKRGRAWNRIESDIERRILQTRAQLRELSVLGEYGADAIQRTLHEELPAVLVSRASINRVLRRRGTAHTPVRIGCPDAHGR